jgi:hypothetical protein
MFAVLGLFHQRHPVRGDRRWETREDHLSTHLALPLWQVAGKPAYRANASELSPSVGRLVQRAGGRSSLPQTPFFGNTVSTSNRRPNRRLPVLGRTFRAFVPETPAKWRKTTSESRSGYSVLELFAAFRSGIDFFAEDFGAVLSRMSKPTFRNSW